MAGDSPPRRLPPRLLAATVLVALGLASGLVGAAIDRVVVRGRVAAAIVGDTSYHSLSSALRSPTDADRRARIAQLTVELDLTPVQGDQIDTIMVRRADEFRELRDEIRPRVESLVGAVRGDIEQILTPSQRTRFRAIEEAPAASPKTGGGP